MDVDSLDPRTGKKIDAIRNLVAVTQIRGIAGRRLDRISDTKLRDAAYRLGVAIAMALPAGAPMPSDDFLLEHTGRILNGYEGRTRAPLTVTR